MASQVPFFPSCGAEDVLADLEHWYHKGWTSHRVARMLASDFRESIIYRALDLAASDPRFELAQQSGWLQQVRDAVTELL